LLIETYPGTFSQVSGKGSDFAGPTRLTNQRLAAEIMGC
jgi:hypothetical protein